MSSAERVSDQVKADDTPKTRMNPDAALKRLREGHARAKCASRAVITICTPERWRWFKRDLMPANRIGPPIRTRLYFYP